MNKKSINIIFTIFSINSRLSRVFFPKSSKFKFAQGTEAVDAVTGYGAFHGQVPRSASVR